MCEMYRFSLVEYKVTKLNFSVNEEFENDKDSGKTEILPELGINYIKNKDLVAVNLSIKFSKSSAPFLLSTVLTGMFKFDVDTTDKEIEKIVYINISAILFPFLREVVADITMRAGFSPLLLPPMNFVEAYQQKKQNLKTD